MERQNSDASASQDTLISLQMVDPTPLLDDGSRRNSLFNAPVPDTPKPPTRIWTFGSSLGLSGSGHSSVYYLIRLQRYSSYVFGIFTAFHITNTSLIPLITRSVPASEPYLLLTRPFYQSFPLEPLLVTLPITTHILAGLAIRIHRRNANLARYGASNVPISKRFERRLKVWPSVSYSSLSGYVLAPLVLGHAFANRILPWIYEGGSSGVGLGFVSHGFAKHPIVAWGGYIALIGVGVGHFVWGIARWNGWTPVGSDRGARRRWWTINGITATVTALWMAGGLGIVATAGKADGWVGKGYDMLYSKIPLVKL